MPKEKDYTIKSHEAADVKDKLSQVGVKTKKALQETTEIAEPKQGKAEKRKEQSSAESEATTEVEDTAKSAVAKTAVITKDAVKVGVKAVKRKKATKETQQQSESIQSNVLTIQQEQVEKSSTAKEKVLPKPKEFQQAPKEKEQSIKSLTEKTAKEKSVDIKESQSSKYKATNTDFKDSEEFTQQEAERTYYTNKSQNQSQTENTDTERSAPRQRKQYAPKEREPQQPKTVNENDRSIKTAENGGKSIKQSNRLNNDTYSIKTVGSKTASDTVQTGERIRNTKQKTEKATETIADSAKKVLDAIRSAGKAVVNAGKDLAASIGGGGVVLIIIIVICLIAAIGGTCYGIFLGNDKTTGTEMTVTEAISTLTSEYYSSIFSMKEENNADDIELSGDISINWRDVLSVYAVKYTNSSDGFDVATIDNKKLKKIKKVLEDMYTISGAVVSKVTTTKDENGNLVTTTTNVYSITAVGVSAKIQAKTYKFNDDEMKQLNELLSDDYDALWTDLIGSGGTIIVGESTYVANGNFIWPLTVNGTISSGFGYRSDPATGVQKLHAGTDIAAAEGTPILAAADGIVITAGYNSGGYGYYVVLKHDDTYTTVYGHCSTLCVTAGQTVKQGQVIAKVGHTGYATGNHVHFEVRINGQKVDAMKFYK